ncbi:50S ribosomal protein L18e [Candidatus Woesearchaeota archaeon]|nr:50S ribosomal protein L18e [Candidatus Woesearchaeota archaeon]
MIRSGPTNYQTIQLLNVLDEKARTSPLWKRVAKDVRKPSRQRRMVNIYKIEKFAQDGEIVIVPGKVLSVGDLTKKVHVAALQFSAEAKHKIEAAKGKATTIQELLAHNPDTKKVRILG